MYKKKNCNPNVYFLYVLFLTKEHAKFSFIPTTKYDCIINFWYSFVLLDACKMKLK